MHATFRRLNAVPEACTPPSLSDNLHAVRDGTSGPAGLPFMARPWWGTQYDEELPTPLPGGA